MLRVLLLGYGKMGKEIARIAPQIAPELHIVISAVVDTSFDRDAVKNDTLPVACRTFATLCPEALDSCDVVIDFSSPDKILDRITLIAKSQKPCVIGTTGWENDVAEAKKIIGHYDSSVLTAANFSLGVALFLQLAKQASALMSHFPVYDVSIHEQHHRKKQDGPSGTALALANKTLEAYPEKRLCINPCSSKALEKNDLHVAWQRVGSIPGTHQLLFDSHEDSISLTHTARNREGFAKGALEAAFWLADKKGWYTINDLINDKIAT